MDTATLAERLAYGRPEEATRDPKRVHLAGRPWTALVARVSLAAIFMASGLAKVADPEGSIATMEGAGIPMASSLLWLAVAAEILGAVSLVTGALTRIGALGLMLFLIPTTLLFHDFWNLSGAAQAAQMAAFLKNVAIGGGLGLLVAYGAGRYSVDDAMRRPVEA